MIAKLKALWASLPHPVQAGIVVFVAAVGSSLAHALSESPACFSLACLKHYAATAIVAGMVALRAFYMLPSGTNGKAKPPAPPVNTSNGPVPNS